MFIFNLNWVEGEGVEGGKSDKNSQILFSSCSFSPWDEKQKKIFCSMRAEKKEFVDKFFLHRLRNLLVKQTFAKRVSFKTKSKQEAAQHSLTRDMWGLN